MMTADRTLASSSAFCKACSIFTCSAGDSLHVKTDIQCADSGRRSVRIRGQWRDEMRQRLVWKVCWGASGYCRAQDDFKQCNCG
jgi:hypothetical protein